MVTAPQGSYAITVVVVILLMLAFLTSSILQVLLAVCTMPLLLFPKGRLRFHHWQGVVMRNTFSIFMVAINPFWRAEVQWIGDKPGPTKGGMGCIFFCNHRSNVDPFVTALILLSGCKGAAYVYKSSLSRIPFFGWLLLLVGDLPVHFGDKDQIQMMLGQARELLQNGYNIFVFPEGTRSPSGVLQDFKPTFFNICAEVGCDAVPVCLVGTERAWSVGSMRMGCAKILAAVGQPIRPVLGGGRVLLADVRASMLELAQDLLDGENEDPCSDPLVTGLPYPYWTPPEELVNLCLEEQLKLLRQGSVYERGKRFV